ncbi:hypothetical protein FA10DRAFT_287705 [Acaromyces ingoldii]|uniref:IMS import disulfide relay-system CHCH-CHCH-like Cx9C domain-containing protein n=1 Tax=Acaromyces ingoldii TaxID=215250 RepID=A0A316YF13_9BASI|nr:hypothetical protein FA10DRAFT_287705 [Acaromyces ingoldii]PWN88150.1 hypothetical protein FA10DRAFT_287705 [Acaromyces ingoldii]
MSLKPTSAAAAQRNLAPVRDLAKASAACSEAGRRYAACVIKAQFDDAGPGAGQGIQRGLCDQEFSLFKECVQTKMKKKW